LAVFVAVLAVVTPFGFRVVPEDAAVALVSSDAPVVSTGMAVGSCWR
jgi:hypothetical protein